MNHKSPEQIELNRLHTEQTRLAEELAATELELESIKSDVARFRARYYNQIGRLYADLDAIEAQIAAVLSGKQPENPQLKKQAESAQVQADASAEESGLAKPLPPLPAVITPEIKAAYKRAAMKIHPDRATSDAERQRREGFMSRLNVAYEQGNLPAIEKLMIEFGHDPESIEGGDIGSRMVKVIRRIAQIKRRLGELAPAIAQIQSDEMYELMKSVSETEALGGSPLADLAQSLHMQISEKRIQLELLSIPVSGA